MRQRMHLAAFHLLLLGWRPLGLREAIAIRLEAIAIWLEAIASRSEAIASRFEACAIRTGRKKKGLI